MPLLNQLLNFKNSGGKKEEERGREEVSFFLLSVFLVESGSCLKRERTKERGNSKTLFFFFSACSLSLVFLERERRSRRARRASKRRGHKEEREEEREEDLEQPSFACFLPSFLPLSVQIQKKKKKLNILTPSRSPSSPASRDQTWPASPSGSPSTASPGSSKKCPRAGRAPSEGPAGRRQSR